MTKEKDNELLSIVLTYFQSQNRPYSQTDIVQNLHNKFGKTAIQKSLDILVQQSQLYEKVYGKQKVYALNQKNLPPVSEDMIKSKDSEIKRMESILEELKGTVKSREVKLKALNSAITVDEASKRLEKAKIKLEDLKKQAGSIKTTAPLISPEMKSRMLREIEQCERSCKKRKRIHGELIDTLLENYPKKKKDLLEDIGIDV